MTKNSLWDDRKCDHNILDRVAEIEMKGRRKASHFAIHCSTPHRFIHISLSHKNSSLPLFPSFSVDVGDGDDHLAYGFRQFVRPMKFQLFFQLPSLNRWLCPARWWLDEGMSSYTSYVTFLCGHHKTHLPSSFAIEPLLLLFVPAHLHHHHPPHQLRRMDHSLSICVWILWALWRPVLYYPIFHTWLGTRWE